MDADLAGAAHVGRAMLKAMRETGLPPYEQVQAAIDALIVINGMITSDSDRSASAPGREARPGPKGESAGRQASPNMSSDFGSEDVR